MLGLILIIVLIAATCSAKHVKKVRRTPDTEENCYSSNHPNSQCSHVAPGSGDDYPVYRELSRIRNKTESKRFLLAGDNLESLCSEARTFLVCMATALDGASEKCKEAYYASDRLTEELFDNGISFVDEICDEEVIEAIRSHFDCLWDEEVYRSVRKCKLPNIDKDCSYLETETSSSEVNACYQEKYFPNCDADDVVSCSSEAVASACDDDDAGELVELIGNSFYDKFPICPDNKQLKTLLKFFK